jgi:bifunctional non-homologous end joining protein LigD
MPNHHFNTNRKLRFVVQRHKASHLHYDLRLEIGGTLKSWALKKGPSMNPGDRRLAVMTTNHHLLYRFYRGLVPGPIWRGNKIARLGARIVEIWDKGFYEPANIALNTDPDETMQGLLREKKMEIVFHGEKLKGKFTLIKVDLQNARHYNADKSWLLIKMEDEFAVHAPYDSELLTSKFSLINRALKREREKEHRKG